MLDAVTILTRLELALRSIPALVAGLGGKAANIYSITRRLPAVQSIQQAVSEMDAPQILIVHLGSQTGSKQHGYRWVHNFRLHLRSESPLTVNAAQFGYWDMCAAIANGHPANGIDWAGEVNFTLCTLHPQLDPVGEGFLFTNAFLPDWGAEFWFINLTLIENGG